LIAMAIIVKKKGAESLVRQRGQSVRIPNGIWTVTAVVAPHELGGGAPVEQVEIGWTIRIGIGMSEPCRKMAENPAKDVGSVPEGARTGPVSEMPELGTNKVINCPGATASGAGAT
jgi:hypothetical protein